MRASILVGELVVVVVGVISIFEKGFFVTEIECLGVSFGLVASDILDLGGYFVGMVVEMEVDNLELKVGAVVRIV